MTNSTKALFLGLFCLSLPLDLFATDVSGRLSITPIIGLERVQKFQPTTHMKTRAIYGATAVYRLPITSLEAEYTHAQDTSDDVANNTSYKDSEDKLRLGVRGGFGGPFISTYLRGGAQARKNEQTRTVNSTTVTTNTTSKVQPYAGAGIELSLLKFFSITADVLATYTPTTDPNLKDYELQPSVGIILKF